jgi:hemolysin-activating ACP:hemolysin acyltransferase
VGAGQRRGAQAFRIRPTDWNSGPHPWLIDIAAPPQTLLRVLAELQEHVFKGERVRTLLKRER